MSTTRIRTPVPIEARQEALGPAAPGPPPAPSPPAPIFYGHRQAGPASPRPDGVTVRDRRRVADTVSARRLGDQASLAEMETRRAAREDLRCATCGVVEPDGEAWRHHVCAGGPHGLMGPGSPSAIGAPPRQGPSATRKGDGELVETVFRLALLRRVPALTVLETISGAFGSSDATGRALCGRFGIDPETGEGAG